MNSTGTSDPNSGDSIAYSWNWGDGTAASTGASPSSHVYAAPGNYTIIAHHDGRLGRRSPRPPAAVSLVEPAGNTAPEASFTSNCAVYTTCTFNSAETVDAQGDVIRYAWDVR